MRILLVEDETKVSSFVARGLTEERFAVDVAADGKSGLDLATTYHYDLVILDLMLPGEDGLSICRRLRGGNEDMPIIMLTAKGDDVDRIVGLEVGAARSGRPGVHPVVGDHRQRIELRIHTRTQQAQRFGPQL